MSSASTDVTPVMGENLSSNETQASFENVIITEDLTNPDDASTDVTSVMGENLSLNETQAIFENKITMEDLKSPDDAPKMYWVMLAGKRLTALQDVLDENDKLKKRIEYLEKENELNLHILDQFEHFLYFVKEQTILLRDTVIYESDVSFADETEDD